MQGGLVFLRPVAGAEVGAAVTVGAVLEVELADVELLPWLRLLGPFALVLALASPLLFAHGGDGLRGVAPLRRWQMAAAIE